MVIAVAKAESALPNAMRLFVIALMPLVAYTLPAAPATNLTLYDENLASFLLEMSNLAYCDHQVAT